VIGYRDFIRLSCDEQLPFHALDSRFPAVKLTGIDVSSLECVAQAEVRSAAAEGLMRWLLP
jgi:hypothetical protein